MANTTIPAHRCCSIKHHRDSVNLHHHRTSIVINLITPLDAAITLGTQPCLLHLFTVSGSSQPNPIWASQGTQLQITNTHHRARDLLLAPPPHIAAPQVLNDPRLSQLIP
ncbi:hypothetical protein M0R45_014406 [Rubus argutus]|uniref:Uncharacterized protein n=1 Tax=Rubus argutus TaxID=59490 RepID=A0AAW1XLC3_RUBAR